MNSKPPKNKLAFLDGVRGVAMIVVVFHHFGLGFFPAINYLNPDQIHLGNDKVELLIAKTPLNLFFNGGFAVSIFFVQQSIWKPLAWDWTNSYDLFHVLGSFCLLFVICFEKNFMRFFSVKPFLYLGKISFSFYLIHLAVMCSLGCTIFLRLWKPGTYFIPFFISFAASMAVTFLISHFYYKYVDKTSIRFSEKMGKLITKGIYQHKKSRPNFVNRVLKQ